MTATNYTRVHKISSSGELLWTKIQEITTQPDQKDIAVSSNGGCIVQIDANTIYAFSSLGENLWSNSSFSGIVSITIGDDGMVYVLDSLGLHKINSLGDIEWSNIDVASS
jgi:hypothetical protein